MVTSTNRPTDRQGEYRAICLFRKLENRKKAEICNNELGRKSKNRYNCVWATIESTPKCTRLNCILGPRSHPRPCLAYADFGLVVMMTTLPAALTTFPIYLWGTPLCLYHAPALEQDFFTICQENMRRNNCYDYCEEILYFWKKSLFSHLRNLAQSAARRSATPSSTTTVSSGRAAWWWSAHRYAICLCSLDVEI